MRGHQATWVGGMIVAASAGLGVIALAQGQSGEQRVPVHQEPHHHLIHDSATIRLLDIQIPPGSTTLYHTHDTAILYVPIARSQTRGQEWGGEWSGGGNAAARPAGGAPAPAPTPPPASDRPQRVNSTITYVEKPYTHRVNNVGTSLFRLIGIANRTAGANGAADDISGLSAKAELENNWYRAHRVVLKPGESSTAHKHATAVVIVMQTPGTVASESPVWSPINGPGDYAWHTGADPHVLHNRGASEVELMEIEVRGAAK
jgi:quercetin dioxygenase-like cupin family protein